MVSPLTTQIKNIFENLIIRPNKNNNLKEKSEILTIQTRTIDINRCVKKIGTISNQELSNIFNSLDIILDR